MGSRARGHALLRLTAQLAVVVALLCLAVANVYVRATWSEAEDGVLWSVGPAGIVAQEIATQSPAAAAQLHPGDILEAITGSVRRVNSSALVWSEPASLV